MRLSSLPKAPQVPRGRAGQSALTADGHPLLCACVSPGDVPGPGRELRGRLTCVTLAPGEAASPESHQLRADREPALWTLGPRPLLLRGLQEGKAARSISPGRMERALAPRTRPP